MSKGAGVRANFATKQLVDRVKAAAALGVDQTTAACVVEAKSNHPYNNQTGTAEGSLKMEPAAEIGPNLIRGSFGSYDVSYFINLEIYPGNYPSLRPALDKEAPLLAGRIRKNIEASS